VSHGETGFVVESLDEMADAVNQIYKIDRRRCREYVKERFDVPRMVDDYLRAYELVLSKEYSTREIETLVGADRQLGNTIELSVGAKASDNMIQTRN